MGVRRYIESSCPYCSLVGLSEGKTREETSLKRLSSCDSLDQGAVTMTAFPHMVNSRAERLVVILVSRFVQFFLIIHAWHGMMAGVARPNGVDQ